MVEMQSARLKRAGIARCLLEARDFSHVRLHDNPFIDFISAALPWVLLGLMVLFAILYLNKENDN